MNCVFASLDTCEPCLHKEEKDKTRNRNLWKKDGMPSKASQKSIRGKVYESVLREPDSYRNRKDYESDYDSYHDPKNNKTYYPSKQNRNTAQISSNHGRKIAKSHSKQKCKTPKAVNSYFAPRYVSNSVVENDTHSTYPSTASSSSSDSDESEWTRLTTGTADSSKLTAGMMESKITSQSWMQTYYEKQQEPQIANIWSGDDDFSVGAVKTNNKLKRAEELAALSAQAESAYSSAFSYIRKASHQFSKPEKDPPSDKSMVTKASIRAEDAESAVLRLGIIKRREKRVTELARAIHQQKQLELQRLGTKS